MKIARKNNVYRLLLVMTRSFMLPSHACQLIYKDLVDF